MTHHRDYHYAVEGMVLVPLDADAEDELVDPALLLEGRGDFKTCSGLGASRASLF